METGESLSSRRLRPYPQNWDSGSTAPGFWVTNSALPQQEQGSQRQRMGGHPLSGGLRSWALTKKAGTKGQQPPALGGALDSSILGPFPSGDAIRKALLAEARAQVSLGGPGVKSGQGLWLSAWRGSRGRGPLRRELPHPPLQPELMATGPLLSLTVPGIRKSLGARNQGVSSGGSADNVCSFLQLQEAAYIPWLLAPSPPPSWKFLPPPSFLHLALTHPPSP